jgi:alpha-methylacyl-CoA racemase
MGPIYALHEAGRWRDGRGENTLDGGAPFWRTYQCQDDQWVAISPNDRQFLALLLSRLGLTEKEFGDLHDSSAWPRQRKLLEERFAQKTRAQWCEELEGTDACFSPVLSLTEAPSHPHLKDRGTFIEVEGRLQPAPPFKFSTTPCDHPAPPPTPGQHTVSELQACGLTADEISRLVLPM